MVAARRRGRARVRATTSRHPVRARATATATGRAGAKVKGRDGQGRGQDRGRGRSKGRGSSYQPYPYSTPDPHPNPKQAPVTRWWARARGWTACRGRASRRRTMTSSTPVPRCVPGSPFAALPEHCAAPRSQWQCVLPYGFSLSLRDVFLPSGTNQVCRDFVAACMLHVECVLGAFLFAKVLKILIIRFFRPRSPHGVLSVWTSDYGSLAKVAGTSHLASRHDPMREGTGGRDMIINKPTRILNCSALPLSLGYSPSGREVGNLFIITRMRLDYKGK